VDLTGCKAGTWRSVVDLTGCKAGTWRSVVDLTGCKAGTWRSAVELNVPITDTKLMCIQLSSRTCLKITTIC